MKNLFNCHHCHPEPRSWRRIYFALLLLFLSVVAPAQTPVGTINIDGKEVEIFYKVKGTPATIPPVVVIPTPDGTNPVITNASAKVSAYRYDLLKGFVLNLQVNGKQPTEVSWDGTTFWPFSILTQEANKTGTYWLKSNGLTTKIEVKTGAVNSIPYVIGSTTPGVTQPEATDPIVNTTTPPVYVQDGDFNPNGNPVEMFQVGETYQVPIDRNIIQMSVFSMGKKGIQGMEAYLKQDGKTICYLKNADNELTNGGYFNNNHPMMSQIVIKTGQLEVGYKNATNTDYPITFGLSRIANNMGYTFYQPNGLSSAFFYRQLGKNEASVKKFNVEIGDDYGYISEREPGSLVKDFNVNFWKDGKLYMEEMLWNGDNEFRYNVPVKVNNSETRCIRSKKDGSLEVCLKIDTKGYGETGTVTLVSAKGGLQVSKDMVRISGYVYNYINYSAAEGLKNKDYKLYNNAGYVIGNSIVQKDF